MIINRLNYEEYFIDHLDGKLTPSLEAELMRFLEQNKDIKDELDGIQDVVLVGENTVFPNKSNLKKKSFLKNGIDNEFEYLCIAKLEDVLTINEKEVIEKALRENPDKEKQFLTFQKARVFSDNSIFFPDKSQLKRSKIIPFRYSTLRLSLSIAASITLFFGVYSIGKLIVSDNIIENYSQSNITELSIPSVNKTIEILSSRPISDYKKPIIKSKSKIIYDPIQVNEKEKKDPINIEESIPNIIHRIDLKERPNQERPQREQLTQIAAKYAPSNQILFEQLYAQQEESRSKIKGTKELGVFEVIQYGLKSFGKLIGSDIKLNANKDEKGNIEKITFESNLVAFSTPVGNNE